MKEDSRYRIYFELSQNMIVVLDKDGKIVDLNPAACEILEIEKDDALGQNWFETFIPQEIREQVHEVFLKIMSGKLDPVKEFENEVITTSGKRKLIHWRNSYLEDEHGNIVGTVSTGVDVTEERRIKAALEKTVGFYEVLTDLTKHVLQSGWSEETLSHFLESAVKSIPGAEAGSFVLKDEEGDYYRFVATVGFDLEKLKDVRFTGEHVRSIMKTPRVFYWHKAPPKGVEGREALELYGKREQIKSTLIIPIWNDGELLGYFALDNFTSESAFTEVDLKMAEVIQNHLKLLLWKDQMEKKMKFLLDHDLLTNALTRTAFYERAEKALKLAERHGRAISFVYMDLDNFKKINDTYGHEYGDKMLIAFCKRIREIIRSTDELGRIGGDEFVLMLPETDWEGSQRFIKRLKEAFAEPVKCDEIDCYLSVSAGCATFPQDGDKIVDLLKVADIRMYKDKSTKKRKE
ncbi:MAG TPA: hypothetical protein DHV12_01925 [Thermotogae bacterium]|nr:hypothetical protein [Thermotogota bacterium]